MPVLPTSRIPLDMGQLSRRGFLAAAIASGLELTVGTGRCRDQTSSSGGAGPVRAAARQHPGLRPGPGVIPYSSNIEFPNPMRGQYEDLLVAEYWQGTSYAGTDNFQRYGWSQIQPISQNSFTWTQVDNDIAAAAEAGKRFGMRVMAFAPGFGPDTAMPGWLTSVSGATMTSSGSGGTATFPVWNNPNYLACVQNLITAIGNRYDNDERLSWFEISGYGDWSQMVCSAERDLYGLSCPAPDQTIAQLGYYMNTWADVLTMANVTAIIGYHVAAFPNTRIVTASHPEFVRQMVLGTNFSGQSTASTTEPAIPPGIRYDGLGDEDQYFIGWGYPGDYYDNTPLAEAYLSHWTKAPFLTEWCNYYGTEETSTSFLPTAMQEVVNYNVSLVGSTLTSGGLSGLAAPLSDSDYEVYLRLMMYSGYRYSAAAAVSGSNVTVTWTNWGVAPAYDNWQIVYQVRNQSNNIVQAVVSAYSFLSLGAASYGPPYNWGGFVQGKYATSTPAGDPTPITDTDTFVLTSLPSGHYTIWVQVAWAQHKPNATHTFNAPPMSLAQTGRDGTGAYQIGAFSARLPLSSWNFEMAVPHLSPAAW